VHVVNVHETYAMLKVTVRRRRRHPVPVTAQHHVGETARRWMLRPSRRERGDLRRVTTN